MNVPFIKMFVHENYNYARRKRQNPSRFTRQTSFVPYYTNIFVFTNAQTTEINEIVSKPVSEYLYVESVSLQVKVGASSRWSLSLYFAKRNSDQITIEKTRPTLFFYVDLYDFSFSSGNNKNEMLINPLK